jgi:hypothetical protein
VAILAADAHPVLNLEAVGGNQQHAVVLNQDGIVVAVVAVQEDVAA